MRLRRDRTGSGGEAFCATISVLFDSPADFGIFRCVWFVWFKPRPILPGFAVL